MCAISEEIFNKGREVGLEQGHELGREEGVLSGMLSCVRSLMETMGWTAQEALKNLKVPEEERARYLAML
jgi:predicted transposase YdaD